MNPWTIAALALTAYDGVSTAVAMTVYGAVEANPVLAGAMGPLGPALALVVRVVLGTCLVTSLDGWADAPDSRWEHEPLHVVVALLAAVAAWNTTLLVLAAIYMS